GASGGAHRAILSERAVSRVDEVARTGSHLAVSVARQHLAVQHREEGVGLLGPAPPGRRHRRELVAGREAVLERLLAEAGQLAAIGPEPAPPGARTGIRARPRRARRLDVPEAGRQRPALEEPAGVGLRTIVSGHGAIRREPALERRIERRPREARVVAVA